MKVSNIIEKFNLKVFSGSNGIDREVNGGYTSDLLSDVIGNADAGVIWITLQTHKNTIAIASLKDLAAVVLVKGYEPETDTANQSNIEGIPILGTDDETFEISGKIYQFLNQKDD